MTLTEFRAELRRYDIEFVVVYDEPPPEALELGEPVIAVGDRLRAYDVR